MACPGRSNLQNIFKSFSFLRRIKPYIDVNTRNLYYNGYIRPILDYCSVVWGTCNTGDLQKLLRMQKAAARIISNVGYYESSHDLFKTLKWQPLETQIRIRILVMMYKSLNGMTPNYMKELFKYTSNIHDHNLRSTTQNNLYLSGGRTEYGRRRFSNIAISEWNSLPEECIACQISTSF